MHRIITTNFPEAVAQKMDAVAAYHERSKSWIVREAVKQWLDDKERRRA